MKWTSGLAIYFLFWSLSVFLVLPFGIRTADEAGIPKVPGQADSAPHEFRPGRIAIRVTVVATILWLIFQLNYIEGWITPQTFDIGNGWNSF
ncbi:MAG: DUF1467 family protein [Sphingomonas sp.]|uniref:DUF1467 family protein n=1 Tax=Sphingomonas sp. TaxID=28214 RepID=UPI0035678AF6